MRISALYESEILFVSCCMLYIYSATLSITATLPSKSETKLDATMVNWGGARPMATNHGEVHMTVQNLSPQEKDLDLFVGPPDEYLVLGVPLYIAALEGDWNKANAILQKDPNLARARISKCKETALHIAAAARRNDFVKKLVVFMNEEDLVMQNTKDNTALCYAAASGNVEIAQIMVEKNRRLPLIRGNLSMTPVFMATLLGHRDMVIYLMSVTDFDELQPNEVFQLLTTAINSELYDTALVMLEAYPPLALYKLDGKTALHYLSQKRLKSDSNEASLWSKWTNLGCNRQDKQIYNQTQDKGLQLVKKIWGEIIKMNYDQIVSHIGPPSQLLFDAAKIGNIEFIAILIGSYPDLIWKVNMDNVSIFHIAVSMRQVEVFNLIYEIGAIKDLLATYVDPNGNNMLHLAAKSPPHGSLDDILGAALQMQRELLWYKEVESVVPPQFKESKNNDRNDPKTPWSLFIEQHEPLRKEGEKWMKDTANSCSVVAALIATVAFTAAFTVPGGNNQEKGIPIFQKNATFIVFAIADAISLFSSSMAIFMFLGILTSRYAQEDFLKSLPLKMITGLSSLFLSISSMMVAFASAFFIIFKASGPWVGIPVMVTMLVSIPVILFAYQQSTLLVDIYRSTYYARYLFRPNKHKIFRAHVQG